MGELLEQPFNLNSEVWIPRPRRRRPRPRSVGVFSSGESPIVPQLCPVSLIVEHSGLIEDEDDDEHEDENPDFGV